VAFFIVTCIWSAAINLEDSGYTTAAQLIITGLFSENGCLIFGCHIKLFRSEQTIPVRLTARLFTENCINCCVLHSDPAVVGRKSGLPKNVNDDNCIVALRNNVLLLNSLQHRRLKFGPRFLSPNDSDEDNQMRGYRFSECRIKKGTKTKTRHPAGFYQNYLQANA
jgi:hypothetical protein